MSQGAEKSQPPEVGIEPGPQDLKANTLPRRCKSRLLQRRGWVFAFRSRGPGSIPTSGSWDFSAPCDIWWPVDLDQRWDTASSETASSGGTPWFWSDLVLETHVTSHHRWFPGFSICGYVNTVFCAFFLRVVVSFWAQNGTDCRSIERITAIRTDRIHSTDTYLLCALWFCDHYFMITCVCVLSACLCF